MKHWPLLGREAELSEVLSCLAAERGVAVLAGPAGVGKSRLAEEAARALARRGHEVLHASATQSSARIPFGALAHLLPSSLSAPEDRLEMLLVMRAALLERAAGRGLLLSVDDAHLLDDASATLVHQMAYAGECRVLITVRSGEPVPESIAALWKDDLARRWELAALDRATVEELVGETLRDGLVPPPLLERLWTASEGNPLYLREFLQGMLDAGHLDRDDTGAWSLDAPLAPSIWLTELIEARLRRLGPGERDAAEALAVGQPLDLALLRQVVDLAAIATLERTGIVRSEPDEPASLRLVHPVYAEVLRAELPAARRALIAGRLAEAMAARGVRTGGELLRLATWRLDAGGPFDAVELTRAAEQALDVFDYELAERLAGTALAHGGRGFETRLALGKAVAWQHRRSGEAEEHLAAAADLAGDDAEVARAALARARNLFFRAGRPGAAMEVATAASGQVHDEDWRDELEAMVALFASLLGDLPRAATAGERVKHRARVAPRPLRATLAVATFSEVLLGRFTDAQHSIDLGLSAAHGGTGSPYLTADLLRCYQAMLHCYAGRMGLAERQAREGFAEASAQRADVAGPWGDVLCHVLILRGRVADAAEAGAATAAIVRGRDPFGVLGMTLAGWAFAAALRRDEPTAQRLLDELAAAPAGDPRPGIFADLARARLAAARGEVTGGADLAAERGVSAIASSHLVWGSFLLHEAVRLGRAASASPMLEQVAEQVEGDFVPALARHARALAAGDGHALEQVADAFAAMDAALHAAEAASQAAAAHRRAGRSRAARRCVARATSWRAGCQGAWAPDLLTSEVPLTEREREVALLAGQGLTSRAIGERLVLSPRTVDNHLRAVYSKLGVAGRHELRSVLASPGT